MIRPCGQLSLAHNAKVKSSMIKKNKKQLESVELVRWVETGKVELEESTYGKDEF